MENMQDIILFNSKNGDCTKQDLYNALIAIEADKCEYLFIHSEINFGLPNPNLSKKELLGHIYDVIKSLGVKNLLVPTFTFSFCNREDYNVQFSKSSMGIFSEYFRKLPETKRSLDPLMSVAMIGEDYSVIDDISKNSCAEGSTYDLLHKKGNTKFLFLGTPISACFTYMHYVEAIYPVPYRYTKEFEGNIINDDKKSLQTFNLPVRYKDVEPFSEFKLDPKLLEQGAARKLCFGDTVINIVSEPQAYDIIMKLLKSDIDFFLKNRYPRDGFNDEYIYEKKVAL